MIVFLSLNGEPPSNYVRNICTAVNTKFCVYITCTSEGTLLWSPPSAAHRIDALETHGL